MSILFFIYHVLSSVQSSGVDSMVLCKILKLLKSTGKLNVKEIMGTLADCFVGFARSGFILKFRSFLKTNNCVFCLFCDLLLSIFFVLLD